MPASYTTIAAWSLAIAAALKQQGKDPLPVFSAVGLDLNLLEQTPDSRVPIEKMTALWALLEQQSGNSAFGLQVAACVQPMHFRALGLLMLSCSNMQQILEKMGRYHALVSNTVNVRILQQPDRTGFVIDPLAAIPISPLAIDAFFATILNLSRQLSGKQSLLDEVELIRPQPQSGGGSKPWRDVMQCPVLFSHTTNCLWFNRAALQDIKLPGNEQLVSVNEAVVEQYLTTLNALSWTEKVRNSLRALPGPVNTN